MYRSTWQPPPQWARAGWHPVDTVSFARWTKRMAAGDGNAHRKSRRPPLSRLFRKIELNHSPAFAKEPATNGVGYFDMDQVRTASGG